MSVSTDHKVDKRKFVHQSLYEQTTTLVTFSVYSLLVINTTAFTPIYRTFESQTGESPGEEAVYIPRTLGLENTRKALTGWRNYSTRTYRLGRTGGRYIMRRNNYESTYTL